MKKLIALALIASLAACGGGGSDSSTSGSAPATPPTLFAVDKIARPLGTFTLSATEGGRTYQLVVNYTAPTPVSSRPGSFQDTLTLIMRQDGVVVTQEFGSRLFNADGPQASYSNTSGHYTVYKNAKLPGPQYTGSVGVLGTSVTYTNSSLTQVYSSTSRTWSLDAEGPNKARYCENSVDDATRTTGSFCTIIDPAGNTHGYTFTLFVNGTTVTFR